MPCMNIRTYRRKVLQMVELYWSKHHIPLRGYVPIQKYHRSFSKLGYDLSDELMHDAVPGVHFEYALNGNTLLIPCAAWDPMPVSERDYYIEHGLKSLPPAKRWIDKKHAPVLVPAPTSMSDFLSDTAKDRYGVK